MIQASETNTGLAFETVARGVGYYLRLNGFGRWELSSRRLAMATFGQVRHFGTLEEVESTIKAFRGISLLVEA